MKQNHRQCIVVLVGAGLFVLGLLGRGQGDRAILAETLEQLAYLPVVFAPEPGPTATPTASATASATPDETATATASAVPTGTATPTETATATSTLTPTATSTLTPTATSTALPGQSTAYMPIIAGPPPPPLAVPIAVSLEPPVDFAAEREKAWEAGHDLAFSKIGFHIQLFGERAGLQSYIEALDGAGVPVVLKSANDAEYLYLTQELAKVSGVEHVLIYRDATFGRDIPDYDLDPITAARLNWAENRRVFPPELDPGLVWMETTNEPDRTKAAWLAEFALEQAKMAVREGARYAAFGWSGGEPEPEHWKSEEMLAFLRFAAQHQDQVAVALHEYSFVSEDIGYEYPYLVGRLQALFAVADKHGIPRPTVLVSEWGWEYDNAPAPQDAMSDIEWAAWLYAAYPQVKGAAIWTLGKGGGEFGSIDEDVLQYLAPLSAYSVSNYFLYSPGTRPVDPGALAPAWTPVTPTPSPTVDPALTPTASVTPMISPTPTITLTPSITPTVDPDNPLKNGSFENGWHDIEFGNQRPKSWAISWVEPGDFLYDSPDPATGICECVHKLAEQLPVEEQPGGIDPLILDGTVTYKLFSGQAFGTQLSQTISGLAPGSEYRLSVPLRLHNYGDPDAYGAEAGVWVDGVGDWSNAEDMGSRVWCKHELTFTVPADGSIDIDVRVKSKRPLVKDFFIDDLRLVPSSAASSHPQYPLCDATPDLQRYRPYEELNWFERWLAEVGSRIADLGR